MVGSLEADKVLVKGLKLVKVTIGETSITMMVEGAREERAE